jgi:hypothetical protein
MGASSSQKLPVDAGDCGIGRAQRDPVMSRDREPFLEAKIIPNRSQGPQR